MESDKIQITSTHSQPTQMIQSFRKYEQEYKNSSDQFHMPHFNIKNSRATTWIFLSEYSNRIYRIYYAFLVCLATCYINERI